MWSTFIFLIFPAFHCHLWLSHARWHTVKTHACVLPLKVPRTLAGGMSGGPAASDLENRLQRISELRWGALRRNLDALFLDPVRLTTANIGGKWGREGAQSVSPGVKPGAGNRDTQPTRASFSRLNDPVSALSKAKLRLSPKVIVRG